MSSSALTLRHCNRPGAPMPHSRAFPPRPPSLVLPLTRRSPAARFVRPHPPQGSHARAHRTARALTAHTSPAQSLARTVLRHRRALPAPDSARLPAEVLKLQDLSFCQSISNFMVSLPNLSKRCEVATVPAVAALTLPRPAQEKGKDGLFSSLLRISLLFLIVPVSLGAKGVLQAREIRRIGFSVTFRHN